MKYLPLIIIGFLVSLAKGEKNDRVEIEGFIITQTRLWLLENPRASPDDRDVQIKNIKGNALKDFNKRKLLLGQFEKKEGQIKDKYIDQEVERVVREHYNDDRKKFDVALKKSGLTLSEYKKYKREEMIISLMYPLSPGK